MILNKLSVQSFRNLETASFEFGNGFNIFCGDNAQGKTNILESIYLLGTLKSFRMAKNCDLINWEKQFSLVKGVTCEEGLVREVALLLDRTSKKVRVDQKNVVRVADFFGILTVVLFAPEELTMVRGAPESRRRYLDRAIFAGDMIYLTRHHEYLRILKQRNSLLKSGDTSSLEPWSEQLAVSGAHIVTSRISYLSMIDKHLKETFREISGTADEAGIEYHSGNSRYTDDFTDNVNIISTALNKLKEQEIVQRTTLIGPHRDDVFFSLNGKPLKTSGSQGQQRCFILALKMAEIELLRKSRSVSPVLLLDDMTSELDSQRTSNLLQFLADRNMQVFVTTTSMDNLKMFNNNSMRLFHVKRGTVDI
ncbi:DNA replication/repair protein RecF [Geobacter pelophilus]|jgi:DNA replication and repair protein RecF|uniref:DNA replication and repair protein RecF n=1 Tax=Geoanaerobacter pelophilus TaxID=60036 RepID=A0AAW4L2W4_9BACT|nr:DNA replication/repair protein RecF [Geoanaerobacter pelophilus]MBT0665069.1 DNA replication/repair protein RecF [Geoanaerobacter pelophilus]